MVSRQDTSQRTYRLPPGRIVRRARERYLYDQTGERYLDVWLADGTAFLGHRPRGYGRLVKEETDRGLWGPFPTQWQARLGKALRELSRAAALPVDEIRLINGRYSPVPEGGSLRWLPAGTFETSSGGTHGGETVPAAIEVTLPVPGVVVPRNAVVEGLPAAAIALLTQGAHALTAYLSRDERYAREDVAARLSVPPGYRREGVWFLPDIAARNSGDHATQWESHRNDALTLGILLPPDPWTPLVIPDGMNSADQRNWERMCHGWTR